MKTTTTEGKKLKKVDEININMSNKIKNLNLAYKSKNGHEVDKAVKEIFEYMDSIGMEKESGYYVELKNHTWQKNHLKVIASINYLMQENGRMPTTTEISSNAGLSEETIYKHLKEFKTSELYSHELEKFEFMKQRILTALYNFGVQGDVRACKVYLDHFKEANEPKVGNYQQNNYIQFNNLKLSLEEVENLPLEIKGKIEKIITNEPKPKSNKILLS